MSHSDMGMGSDPMTGNAGQAPEGISKPASAVGGARGDLLPIAIERRIGQCLWYVVVIGIVFFGLVRFANLTTDFPSELSWDGDAYTDEGLYAGDAINWVQEGAFYQPLDYNQFVNLPLMQFIKAGIFLVFGISLLAARLLTVLFAFASFAALYYLIRRFEEQWVALTAVLVMATSHILFAFSRFAIDEIPVMFWLTLTFAFAVRVQGDRWWLFAILTSLAFACAMLTKSSAIYTVPLVAGAVILQDLSFRSIVMKFLLCSAVFLSIMGIWYVGLVAPYRADFDYFRTINLDIAKSETFARWKEKFLRQSLFILNADPILPIVMTGMTPILCAFSARFRRHPLIPLSILWILLHYIFFAYYGRYFPRFLTLTIPPMAIWMAVSIRCAIELRGIPRLILYLLVGLLSWSTILQINRTLILASIREDSFNEMSADILRIVESDPTGNRVIMGHTAAAIALRTNLTPRHDRYSPFPMNERLAAFNPGWAVSEGEFRILPPDIFNGFAEYYDLLYEIDLVASYDVLDNFRGYKIHLYKLTPREEVCYPTPFVRASLPPTEEPAP